MRVGVWRGGGVEVGWWDPPDAALRHGGRHLGRGCANAVDVLQRVLDVLLVGDLDPADTRRLDAQRRPAGRGLQAQMTLVVVSCNRHVRRWPSCFGCPHRQAKSGLSCWSYGGGGGAPPGPTCTKLRAASALKGVAALKPSSDLRLCTYDGGRDCFSLSGKRQAAWPWGHISCTTCMAELTGLLPLSESCASCCTTARAMLPLPSRSAQRLVACPPPCHSNWRHMAICGARYPPGLSSAFASWPLGN